MKLQHKTRLILAEVEALHRRIVASRPSSEEQKDFEWIRDSILVVNKWSLTDLREPELRRICEKYLVRYQDIGP